jgi:hypothetical protein
MSIIVLIITFITLILSLKSVKNLFKSNNKMQEEFIEAYNKALEKVDSKIFDATFVVTSFLYLLIWIIFYVIVFNVFNDTGSLLSLIAVFFLLQTIYNCYKSFEMYTNKQIKSHILNRVLNVIELGYIVYFICFYIVSRLGL